MHGLWEAEATTGESGVRTVRHSSVELGQVPIFEQVVEIPDITRIGSCGRRELTTCKLLIERESTVGVEPGQMLSWQHSGNWW